MRTSYVRLYGGAYRGNLNRAHADRVFKITRLKKIQYNRTHIGTELISWVKNSLFDLAILDTGWYCFFKQVFAGR